MVSTLQQVFNCFKGTFMSIFNSILSKLGMGNDKKEAAPEVAVVDAPAAPAAETAPVESAPVAISDVDVVAKLSDLAAAHAETLHWKTSIVDLMKLLDIDSSLAARKELASELDCPAEKMEDSAQMNMWLHQNVLQQLAANGGNIPADLLS